MIRRFKESDAETVSALVARTLREVNIKDYSIYRKLGYDYKDGINKIDDEGLYRLEKFNN